MADVNATITLTLTLDEGIALRKVLGMTCGNELAACGCEPIYDALRDAGIGDFGALGDYGVVKV